MNRPEPVSKVWKDDFNARAIRRAAFPLCSCRAIERRWKKYLITIPWRESFPIGPVRDVNVGGTGVRARAIPVILRLGGAKRAVPLHRSRWDGVCAKYHSAWTCHFSRSAFPNTFFWKKEEKCNLMQQFNSKW